VIVLAFGDFLTYIDEYSSSAIVYERIYGVELVMMPDTWLMV
jgi:hypothetical protein